MISSRIHNLLLLLIILPVLSLITQAQVTTSIPSAFIETIPPKVLSKEWSLLNQSRNEFAVKISNNKLEIKKISKTTRICELKITDGLLIGINRGEYGGQLTFRPTDTTKKSIEIKQGNVKFIFSFENKIYFIEGLAHATSSEGALFELRKTKRSFKFKKLIDFDDAPEAFTIHNDQFLIATHKKFYIVKDFNKELLLKETFWDCLYPNSIAVIDDQNVFIGIRSGIVKLDIADKTFKFYKHTSSD
jgi:hypothetical protein